MNLHIKTGVTLFVLGLSGVISLLFTPLPLDAFPEEVLADLPVKALPYLTLINPTIFLIVAVLIGGSLSPKVQLSSPLIKEIILRGNFKKILYAQLIPGVTLGLFAGVFITLFSTWMSPFLSEEFLEIGQKFSPSPITRFLYGGITEELLLRWGFMTLVVWLTWKLFSRKANAIRNSMYWTGIIISAVVFGLGHLPAIFFLLETPTTLLIVYAVFANSVFGVVAGWLYWKKGLEAAMFAHISVHIVLLIAGLIT